MKRKICVVTGSRAEYGLLRHLMGLLRDSDDVALQLVVTGAHLSPEHGLTYREIETDGFIIDRKVEMLLSSDTESGVATSMGLGLIGFGNAWSELRPDLVVLLGDRYETFSAAAAALIARIPVGHLHGGETTEGAYDESLRHSITKMSHLHFVANEAYRRRVMQLGEQPDRVFNVGAPGVDSAKNLRLMDRDELERSLGFRFRAKNLLITFHPATLDEISPEVQLSQLLDALAGLEDTGLLFTMPNADSGSRPLAAMITNFVSAHSNSKVFTSMGQLRYLSCMKQVDGVIGNSSSGLIEAPAIGVGTVNIGDRQRGRLRASSVIDCEPDSASIRGAMATLFSAGFRASLDTISHPYGDGKAGERIATILKTHRLDGLVKKPFYDLPAV